jgi:hypothetical protein
MSVTLSLFAGAGAQFLDDSGNVLTGGLIYTYSAGTTTPLETYTSNLGNTAHTNPIVLNAAGRVSNGGEIWLTTGFGYKFVLKDANNVLIATYDNIPSSAQPPIINDASSVAYEQGAIVSAGSFIIGKTYQINSIGTTDFQSIGAASNTVGIHFIATGVGTGNGTAKVSRTVENKLQEVVSVKDFGAIGDGVADDTAAIQNAIDAAAVNGLALVFPTATYKINSEIIHNADVIIDLQQSLLDFSSCTDAQAWTITGGNGSINKNCLANGILKGVPTPADGVYSATTNGINFTAPQYSIANINVSRTCFTFCKFFSNLLRFCSSLKPDT